MAKKSFFALALFGVIFLGCSSTAASLPEFTAPVVDETGRVSQEVQTQINTELNLFQQSGGPQIAVAVVKSTGNATLENYSIDLARSWGIGDKDKDNGVLILIALEDRTLRIEVGSGIEGDLTDIAAGRIIDSVMRPRLRANDLDGAVRDGARAVMQVWRGEGIPMESTTPGTPATEPSQEQSIFGAILFFGLIIFFVTMAARGKMRGGGFGPFVVGTMYGRGFGNQRGGFGGGFGGFGGGGGGGFSGGGASGSW